MLIVYAVIFCLALAAAVLLAPVVRIVAVRIGAVDRPDGKRKIHSKIMPRLGGPVIVGAICFAMGVHGMMSPESFKRLLGFTSAERAVGFLGGLFIILGVGIWDDIKGVKPRTKVLFQTLAVIVCFAAGYRIDVPFVEKGTLSILSFPITWFWLVACINAMNLVDGMDGLASGVAFFAGAVVFALAAIYTRVPVAMVAAAMLGSIVGFLMYNFHPAVMFLGDSGSLVLGYLVAILAMSASLKSHATVALLIPILALGLPIMDTLLAILRRWSRRLPVSQADREHIHHRLLAMGFSHREAVVVLYCACIVLAAAALAVASASSLVVGLVLAGICVFGVLAVHFIGASELITFFERIGEMLRARGAEKLHSAAKKSAFHVMLSRSHDQVVEALQPYLAELPASRARIARPGLSHEPIVEIEGKPTTGGGRIEELFTLPGGGRLLLVVEGVEGTASQLPGEVRQALARVFSDMEGEDRGRQAAEDSSGVVSEGAA